MVAIIDTATTHDWQFFACCFILIAMVSAYCGYLVGKSHGWERGYWSGQHDAEVSMIGRTLKAKHQGYQTGWVAGRAHAERNMSTNQTTL